MSIIINNYNYGRFLRDAIDSALQQSYRPIEVIVVDDGSTDGSQKLIADYGGAVLPVLKNNGGQASALNAGFERSRGDVVIFLDADDTLLPHLAGQVAAVFRSDPEVVKAQFRLAVIDAGGARTGETIPSRAGMMPSGDLRPRLLAFPDDIRWQPTSGNALRAEVLRAIFPAPERDYRLCADYYISNLSALFGRVVSLDGIGGCYRVHGANRHHRTEADLAAGREIIVRTLRTHSHLKRFAEALGMQGFPEDPADVRSVTFIAHRLVSCKLNPYRHPIRTDTVPTLRRSGIRASFGRFDLPFPVRLLFALWFAAVSLGSSKLVERLARLWLYRTDGRLAGRLLAIFRPGGDRLSWISGRVI